MPCDQGVNAHPVLLIFFHTPRLALMPDVLHYRGNQVNYDDDWMLGPDMDKRRLKPVAAEYDSVSDITTITLKAIMPAEFRERVQPLIAQEVDRRRIAELFGGAA